MRREILEEFGLRFSAMRLYHRTYWNEYDTGDMITFPLEIVFICDVLDWSQLETREPEEVTPAFVSLRDLHVREVGLDSMRRILSDYRSEMMSLDADVNPSRADVVARHGATSKCASAGEEKGRDSNQSTHDHN